MFKAHGSFDIDKNGRVLSARIKGAWNLETALEYRDAINDITVSLRGPPWALITDINEWELFTPECFPVVSELLASAIQGGLTREAIVNATDSIKLQLFRQPKPEIQQYTREIFSCRQDAEDWLKQEGFDLA